jgi:hypothetical protein
MLGRAIVWIFRAVAPAVLAAAAFVLMLMILLALNVAIFHVPLSTR